MGGDSSNRRQAPAWGRAVSRRAIFFSAAGAAAVGAAGGVLLADADAPHAQAAEQVTAVEQVTTVEQGAMAPAVVALTDAATIAVDASLGNDFRLTIDGNRTVCTPVNPAGGQRIIFQVTQGSGAPFTLTWASGYEFSSALPQPTLSTAAGQTDLLGFIYSASKGTWLLAAFVNGFD